MNGAALVAIAATIGNLLQGWDNATIAGTGSFSNSEFNFFNLMLDKDIHGSMIAGVDWIFLFPEFYWIVCVNSHLYRLKLELCGIYY